MARKRFENFNCSIARSLDEIGDWWTLLIVREAMLGAGTFSEFQTNLGIARNILTGRLERLVSADILKRVQVRPGVNRFTYELTEKGRDLLSVLVALLQWGDKWVSGVEQAPVSILDTKRGKSIRDLKVQAENGTRLALENILFAPGPGADDLTRKRLAKRSTKDK